MTFAWTRATIALATVAHCFGIPAHGQAKALEIVCDGELTFYTVKPAATMDASGIYVRVSDSTVYVAGSSVLKADYSLKVADEAEFRFLHRDPSDTVERSGSINRYTGRIEITQVNEERVDWGYKGECKTREPRF